MTGTLQEKKMSEQVNKIWDSLLLSQIFYRLRSFRLSVCPYKSHYQFMVFVCVYVIREGHRNGSVDVVNVGMATHRGVYSRKEMKALSCLYGI